MNEKRLVFYLVFYLIMYPFNIKAEDCSLSALYKLKAYANAAEIKYHYYRGYDANDRFCQSKFVLHIN